MDVPFLKNKLKNWNVVHHPVIKSFIFELQVYTFESVQEQQNWRDTTVYIQLIQMKTEIASSVDKSSACHYIIQWTSRVFGVTT